MARSVRGSGERVTKSRLKRYNLYKAMKRIFVLIPLFVCISCTFLHAQKFKNLALTPPMGWSTWNTFKADINEQLIKEIADAFVIFGYKEAG